MKILIALVITALLTSVVISALPQSDTGKGNGQPSRPQSATPGKEAIIADGMVPDQEENRGEPAPTGQPVQDGELLSRSIYQRASESPTGMLPTDESLAIFQERVEKNPQDYASWLVMGRLYMRRAEENDDFRDLVRAEQAFDNTLAVKPRHLGGLTFQSIVLNHQHKFHQALEVTTRALEVKPENFTAMAEQGDALMQLGQLDEARQRYERVHELAETPGSYARLARHAELTGEPERAVELLRLAIEKAEQFGDDQLGWYHWRIADVLWQLGDLHQCEQALASAFQSNPGDSANQMLKSRLLAAQGKWSEAVEVMEESVSNDPAPPALALLGDLYWANQQPDLAKSRWEEAQQAMAEEAVFAGDAHLRERAGFLLDHDRQWPDALEMAKKDLDHRQDIYTYDMLAWAFHKNGQSDEAVATMEKALSSGSLDPLLHFHAMEIHRAAGNLPRAKAEAQKLRDSNLAFHPAHTTTAIQSVEQLLDNSDENAVLEKVTMDQRD